MIRCISIVAILVLVHAAFGQSALRDSLERIAADAKGNVGVSLLYTASGRQLSFHGKDQFPMQSVFKFPLALKILHDVDEGVYSLDQLVHIDEQDWVKGTWSPLRDSCKGKTVNIPLREVVRYTVSASDNNGCDILFRLTGGTKAVQDFIHEKGVTGIAIVATEAEMARAWEVQYKNWCTPEAMTTLLRLFMEGRLLSRASTQLLTQFLVETTTGPHRIKGLLPPSMIVAHKTGTSNTSQQGITAATNDVGIITLPDGSHLIISVFVKDAHADEATREAIIARIAAAATHAAGSTARKNRGS